MRNKNHSQSNADTEDGDDEDSINLLPSPSMCGSPICDVWMQNFESQLKVISSLAVNYPVVALVVMRLARTASSLVTSWKGIF